MIRDQSPHSSKKLKMWRSWRTMLLSFFLTTAYISEVISIRVYRVDIPHQVGRGQDAQLNCLFSLDEQDLYSVKWYKGNREFFRVVRGDGRTFRVFPLPDLTIDIQRSNVSTVYLKNVQKNNAGRYRCEVSGEAPHFVTDSQEANMTVLDLPLQGPTVMNVQASYFPGELVSLNCTSAPSHPKANLLWYIDGIQAPNAFLRRYNSDSSSSNSFERTAPAYTNSPPLANLVVGAPSENNVSVLGLEFVIDFPLYASEISSKRNISCVATVGDIYKSSASAFLNIADERRRMNLHPPTIRTPSHHMFRTTGGSLSLHRVDRPELPMVVVSVVFFIGLSLP